MKKKIITGLALVSVVVLSGCGEVSEGRDKKGSLYPPQPTISASSLVVDNGGSTLTWNVRINNLHKETKIKVTPWNDSTYFWADIMEGSYSGNVELECNTNIANMGNIKCNDVTQIICDRVSIGADYNEYRCDFAIGEKHAIVAQYKKKMRIPTYSNGSPSEETLMTIGTMYWYDRNGYEESRYIYMTDENKMFNIARDAVNVSQ